MHDTIVICIPIFMVENNQSLLLLFLLCESGFMFLLSVSLSFSHTLFFRSCGINNFIFSKWRCDFHLILSGFLLLSLSLSLLDSKKKGILCRIHTADNQVILYPFFVYLYKRGRNCMLIDSNKYFLL